MLAGAWSLDGNTREREFVLGRRKKERKMKEKKKKREEKNIKRKRKINSLYD